MVLGETPFFPSILPRVIVLCLLSVRSVLLLVERVMSVSISSANSTRTADLVLSRGVKNGVVIHSHVVIVTWYNLKTSRLSLS